MVTLQPVTSPQPELMLCQAWTRPLLPKGSSQRGILITHKQGPSQLGGASPLLQGWFSTLQPPQGTSGCCPTLHNTPRTAGCVGRDMSLNVPPFQLRTEAPSSKTI